MGTGIHTGKGIRGITKIAGLKEEFKDLINSDLLSIRFSIAIRIVQFGASNLRILTRYWVLKTLIPARGGSKGIPRKNVKLFAGKPLIAWTIEQAISVGLKPIVSTEDTEIADIAVQFGADVVYRPEELAQDDSTIISVIEHFVKKTGAEMVVMLQPTSPLRRPEYIQQAMRFYEDGFDSVFTAYRSKALLRLCRLYVM